MTLLLRADNHSLGCCPPIRTLTQIHKDYIWETFHQDLLNGGEAVGRIVDVLQYLLDTVNIPNISPEKNCEFFAKGGEIDNLDISRKFRNYTDIKIREANMTSEEVDKYSRNLAANLLRGFKYIKEGKPVFLLPEQDKHNLAEFVSTFTFPPYDKFYRDWIY